MTSLTQQPSVILPNSPIEQQRSIKHGSKKEDKRQQQQQTSSYYIHVVQQQQQPPTPPSSPNLNYLKNDDDVFPKDLSYVSPKDLRKTPTLEPLIELEGELFQSLEDYDSIKRKLVEELEVVFENAKKMDYELSVAEAIEFERLRLETLDEANAALEEYEREKRVHYAKMLEKEGRNEKCVENPWLSRRPRELALQEIVRIGEERLRLAEYEKAILLETEERIRRETLDEYADVQSRMFNLSWSDIQNIEELARKEKMESRVDEYVESRYVRVLDEFENHVELVNREREGEIVNEMMEYERLRKLVLLESDDALAEFERKELKRMVLNFEEQERLERIVRDCSTDYRTIQYAEVSGILDEIQKLASSKERRSSQKQNIVLMEEERTRRVLVDAGLTSFQ